MDDTAAAVDAAQQQAPASHEAAATAPLKKPGLLRKSALVIVVVLVAAVVATLAIAGGPWLRGTVEDAIEGRGLEIGSGTVIDASLLGGFLAFDQADIAEQRESERRSVYRSPRTAIDVAVLDSVVSGDVVIDELTAREVLVSLRRFADGSLPAIIEDPEADASGAGRQPTPQDLVAIWEQTQRWRERLARLQGHVGSDDEGATAEAGKQPVVDDPRWAGAKRFLPAPAPGAAAGSRVLIRRLDVGGSGVELPDGGAEGSPLDLVGFDLKGSEVALRLDEGEQMRLDGSFTTRGAGGITLACARQAGEGALDLRWDALPVATLADPKIAGDRLAPYGASGVADVVVDADWVGEALGGTVTLEITDLALAPQAGAPAGAAQAKKAVDELRQLHQQLTPDQPFVVRWQLQLGGTPWAPRITDLGVDSLLKALRDQIADKAKQKVDATRRQATEAVQGQLDGLKQDLEAGKDPKESVEGAGDALKDAGRKLFGR